MNRYYADKLSAERLRRCYDVAPDRVRRFLDAEIAHVLTRLPEGGRVLDMGCGYGRVIPALLTRCGQVAGIDNSFANLAMARQYVAAAGPRCMLSLMNAGRLGFGNAVFDAVLCIQNGISAFKVDPQELLREMMRVTRAKGRLILSSYADAFWEHRLEWFRRQAEHGLIGEIDWTATGNGVIACKDGFRALTWRPEDFQALADAGGVEAVISTVDDSSVFCEISLSG